MSICNKIFISRYTRVLCFIPRSHSPIPTVNNVFVVKMFMIARMYVVCSNAPFYIYYLAPFLLRPLSPSLAIIAAKVWWKFMHRNTKCRIRRRKILKAEENNVNVIHVRARVRTLPPAQIENEAASKREKKILCTCECVRISIILWRNDKWNYHKKIISCRKMPKSRLYLCQSQ